MAVRVAEALGACVTPVRVVLRPGAPSPIELPRVDDRLAVRAPIAGLHAALSVCTASAVLVAACDLPEIEPRLLLALLALAPAQEGADAVVPEGTDGPQPLLAVYRPAILRAIESRVARGELSLRGLLDDVRCLRVAAEDLRRFDPELRSLRNVNRPEDLDP
jgi:molybdopterin-guanine dinucleotide biosynthesis protein A